MTKIENSILFLDEISEKINTSRLEIEKQKKLAANLLKKNINKIFRAFFKAVPKIKTVTWVQYTPYFADGDSCIFSMNEFYFSTNENEESDPYDSYTDGDDWMLSIYDLKNKKVISREEVKICEKLMNIFHQNEELCEAVWGDHVQVKATANGIETDSYEHD